MHWLKTGATHYKAQLGTPDKKLAIKGASAFFMLMPRGLLKRFGPTLLSTIPRGIDKAYN